ncbi:YcaO-like family protein [Streptomyces sp. NPDC047043]|uniref:YcaO-like family protein n=1 Tax=Streptomyces sp. NPDC047043 TaxID=3154497 RepID=UPI0033FC733B
MRHNDMLALRGTVRARSAEETWQAVAPFLTEFGITRVAKLTGLDCIGLPVWTAIRPSSRTLSGSQGKGATDLLAKLSAVMEAIELWHVEQPLPITTRGPARDVAPNCPVSALPLTIRYDEDVLTRVVLEWTTGTRLMNGEKVLLPVDLVRRRVQRPPWTPDLLRATTTGLACGNTRDEALLHALYEVVERDVLLRNAQSGGQRRTFIDPGTVDDTFGREVVERLADAGMAVELALVDGPYGLPVCVAYIWSEDLPTLFAGGGCHSDPGIAATRALTEAAQSRLAAIAGTRDDLPSTPASSVLPAFCPPQAERLTDWAEATARFSRDLCGFADQVDNIARQITEATGHEPTALDLPSSAAPIHAVQVICPGTRSRVTRTMHR